MSLLPISCAIIAAGLAARAYSADDPTNAQVYTASTLLLYMAPYVIFHPPIHSSHPLSITIPYHTILLNPTPNPKPPPFPFPSIPKQHLPR